jgi:hypothetical protein
MVPSSFSSTAPFGQLAILQPTSGGEGVSQLVAHLVLAPMSSGPQMKSTLDKSKDQPAPSGTAKETQGSSFLLAPSTSPNGMKLQMIEVQPSRFNTAQEKWKYVKFQATLTDSYNRPKLYCATVQSPSSLQMELCDQQEEVKRSSDEEKRASRVFLYDSSTGEVVPSQPDASSSATVDQNANGDNQQAIDRALAEALGSSPPEKRQDKSDSRPVKLVFFLDQAEQKPPTSHAISTGFAYDAQTPPLLRPS